MKIFIGVKSEIILIFINHDLDLLDITRNVTKSLKVEFGIDMDPALNNEY